MKFQLKVRDGVSDVDLREILAEACTPRIKRFHQLAPDHPVEEMRNLYSFEAPDSVDDKALLRRLMREQAIEFIEPEVTRKLVRPIRRDKL
ncbi:hypothetical protein WCE37_10785 [Luteimonas sp. MJ250]|uniref:hypothetical protein n=1 Tax=Luteimonas sp. MJ250 TaxID=3129236 RepID=UPI0031BBCDAC